MGAVVRLSFRKQVDYIYLYLYLYMYLCMAPSIHPSFQPSNEKYKISH